MEKFYKANKTPEHFINILELVGVGVEDLKEINAELGKVDSNQLLI